MNRSRSISPTRKIKHLIDHNQPSRGREFEGGQPMPDRSPFAPSGSSEHPQIDYTETPDQPRIDLRWHGFGFERVRDYDVQSHML